MALPSLSPEQRSAALEKAAQARRARAAVKDRLRRGETTLAEVLDAAAGDEAVGKMRVSDVLEALPGIGQVRAERLMQLAKISTGRRLRGLGDNQRRVLLTEIGSGRR